MASLMTSSSCLDTVCAPQSGEACLGLPRIFIKVRLFGTFKAHIRKLMILVQMNLDLPLVQPKCYSR